MTCTIKFWRDMDRGTTCGKGGPKFAVTDGPGGPVTKYLDPRNVRTPRSKYFEIFGPPLKYLDRVRSACCSRVVNCTKTRFVRSWDDTLLTRCHEPSLLPIRDEETSFQNVEGEETYNVSSVEKKAECESDRGQSHPSIL